MKLDSSRYRLPRRRRLTTLYRGSLILVGLPLVFVLGSGSLSPQPLKRVIGPVTEVHAVGDLRFVARVDTGAATCSLHVDNWTIVDESPVMLDNVGKTIRFSTTNLRGESEWLEREIAELAIVKTTDRARPRYKVPMTLTCNGVSKDVLVTLNDRSHMTYPLLLGRNFLDGDFVVDVSQSNTFP